MYFLLMQIY